MNARQNGIISCVILRSRDAREYSRAVRRAFCVCMLQCLCSENRTESSSLLRRQIYPYVCSSLTPTYWYFWTFYETCSKCIIAYVLPVHMYASNLLTTHYRTMFWLNLFPNRPSLTFSSCFYLLTNMSIDFRHSFCHSKRVFVRHCLVVVVDDNYDENYSATKLTLYPTQCTYVASDLEMLFSCLTFVEWQTSQKKKKSTSKAAAFQNTPTDCIITTDQW